MKKRTIPCFVAPVARVATAQPDIPCKQVQCHCPQACWVALSTLAAVEAIGGKPTYFCPTCIPDEVRDQVQAMSEVAKAGMAAGLHDPGQPIGGFIHGARNYNEDDA